MKFAFALLLAAVAFSGCAHKKKHVKLIPASPHASSPRAPNAGNPPPPPAIGYEETGIASWYGRPYHGRPAADGEIYDMETMVAAHRTLPFDTWVRVYDLDNNKTVEVRIIDRGPFVDGRIIDLSHAAAKSIEMIGPGIAHVRMQVIEVPRNAATPTYVVQVGAFEDRATAERVCTGMTARYGKAQVMERKENPGVFRVMVGHEATIDAANALRSRIRRETGERKAFVVRLDS